MFDNDARIILFPHYIYRFSMASGLFISSIKEQLEIMWTILHMMTIMWWARGEGEYSIATG